MQCTVTIAKKLSAKFLTIIACFMGVGVLLIQTAHSASANVVLAVSQSGSPVAGSGTVTYQISLSNTGNAGSGGFTVQASVPVDTTVSQAQAGNGTCTGPWPCTAGEELYWDTQLSAGATATLQFSAQVLKTPPKDGTELFHRRRYQYQIHGGRQGAVLGSVGRRSQCGHFLSSGRSCVTGGVELYPRVQQ
jgi:uncharacterized repeat protein (TIGR01451 family)